MIELNLAFLVQLINFGILLFVLNQFLYKPIRKILAERHQGIDAARVKAESVDLEVQNKMAQYESRLKEAKADIAARRGEAFKQAQAEEELLLEKARKEAAESLIGIRNRIANEARVAENLLKQQVEGLSGTICEKILGRGL